MVWIATAIGVGVSSGMLRFLVIIFPVALAGAVAGAAALYARSARPLRALTVLTLLVTVVIGFAGMLVYERPALAAGAGLVPREEYLRNRAQDEATVEFLNSAIPALAANAPVLAATGPRDARSTLPEQPKTLVFLRHIYRLRIAYLYGDPDGSWAVDPERLQTADAWLAFLHQQRVLWVVRAPNYPPSIAAPLRALEAAGGLVPVAQGSATEFHGMRIQEQRSAVQIVILRVAQ